MASERATAGRYSSVQLFHWMIGLATFEVPPDRAQAVNHRSAILWQSVLEALHQDVEHINLTQGR